MAVMLLVNAPLAFAGETEDMTITITIKHSKSIKPLGTLKIDLVPGEKAVSSSAITIENDGTGIEETIKLTKFDGFPTAAGWEAKFQLTDTNVKPVGTVETGWVAYSAITGVIAHGEKKYLWMRLGAPKPTNKDKLDITIEIKAE